MQAVFLRCPKTGKPASFKLCGETIHVQLGAHGGIVCRAGRMYGNRIRFTGDADEFYEVCSNWLQAHVRLYGYDRFNTGVHNAQSTTGI